jgi:hypothetical protein
MNLYRLNLVFLSAILFCSVECISQIPKGTWRDHLSYNKGKIVAVTPDRVYCITEKALFYYEKSDGSIQKMSKINGLSDLEPGYIAYSDKHKKVLVVYNNGNIDIFDGDSKTNFPDIKLKSMVGSKTIQHINIVDDYAYLSYGFGIVVFNLLKNEISDSYIIGPEGSYIQINSTAIYHDTIYASTETGLLKANVNDPFLSNYSNWKKENRLLYPDSPCIATQVFSDQLLVLNKLSTSGNSLLNRYNGVAWDTIFTKLDKIRSISVSEDKLVVIKSYNVWTYNTQWQATSGYSAQYAQHALYDKDGNLWLADSKEGLLLKTKEIYKTIIRPNGPADNYVFELMDYNGNILVAPGGHLRTGESVYLRANVNEFSNESWNSLLTTSYDSLVNLRDVICFASNSSQSYYAGTWKGYGLIEVTNGKVTRVYNNSNTGGVLGNSISGCAFDQEGNLWIVNEGSQRPIVVKTREGKWYNYSYDPKMNNKQTHKLISTHTDDLWHIFLRGTEKEGAGINVWNCNHTPEKSNDDQFVSFLVRDKELTLLNNELYDIVQDLDGVIWIGTANGVVVYDYPEQVFSEPMYARVPQLVVDGYLKNLLEGEVVTSIDVDGANRKWIGTAGGGLFLVSADGTEQIMVWNVDNSKLFSNNIVSVEVNQKTGEVFIGTDNGMQSYMSTATQANSDFSSIYAFPNPVKDGYQGLITIRGLQYETNIKITDISGHLVFETTSNGGDAIWNGKDMEGNDVQSGVYMVLCNNATGEESAVTKILIVR